VLAAPTYGGSWIGGRRRFRFGAKACIIDEWPVRGSEGAGGGIQTAGYDMGKFNQTHLIRRIDLFTLRLFLSVVEEGQIGRAAARENIAPSTATKRIQDLEEIAGIELLDRSAKGVVPSAAGAVMLRYARDIVDSIEGLRAEIAAFNDGREGKVTIASARSIIDPFLTSELSGFARDFPLVELDVHEVENSEIVEMVARGDADIGVFAKEPRLSIEGLRTIPFREDRLVAIVPRSHRFADRARVSFSELMSENIIALKALMGAFVAAAKRSGVRFDPRFSVKSPGLAVNLVRDGFGVAILPEGLLTRENLENVASIKLDEMWARRIIHVATARNRPLNPVAEQFLGRLTADV
jgi:DNA-binding transcriptional LysR family regulator